MSLPLTELISTLFQNQWSSIGTGLLVTDINWSHTRFEAISQLDAIPQNVIFSIYNPPKPTKSTPKSRECALVEELVVLDLLIKPGDSVETALQTRETIIRWLQDTIQLNQFGVSGQAMVEMNSELVKAELPNLIRSAWLLKGFRIQINQTGVNQVMPQILTGNAEITDVLFGKTFYKDDPVTKLTGTLVPSSSIPQTRNINFDTNGEPGTMQARDDNSNVITTILDGQPFNLYVTATSDGYKPVLMCIRPNNDLLLDFCFSQAVLNTGDTAAFRITQYEECIWKLSD